MNKHYLFRKASVIHAIKCNKSANLEVGIQSYNQFVDFKVKIEGADDNDINVLNAINAELNIWAGQNPIAKDTEINNLINGR